jgi:hypothetical protein
MKAATRLSYRLFQGIVWLVAAGALAACTSPCSSLAERTCARAGQASALCKQVQEVAASPTEADEQACSAGLTFVDQLEKR